MKSSRAAFGWAAFGRIGSRWLAALCLALLLLEPVQAATTNNKAASRLGQLLAPVNTLTGRFTQLTVDGSGKSLQQSKGQMALRRPGLFRWHTDAPQEQLLVSDGQQVWLYDPDLQQVTVRQLDQRLSHTPALLLSGDITKISKDFDISYQESGPIADFDLRPKARDTLFDSLRISFQDGTLKRMLLIDNAGQRTNILFNSIKTNPKLDDKQFRFQVPKGADLIQE